MSLLVNSLRAAIRSLAPESRFTSQNARYPGFFRSRRHDQFSSQVYSARNFRPRLRADEFHRRMFMCRGIEG